MSQNQTELKQPNAEEPREEGLDETTCCALRGGPEVWVIGAWGDSITVTTAEEVMREVRDLLDDGCRTITIERQGAPDRTDGGCTPIVPDDAPFLHNTDYQTKL
jgi:hypothetical protein